MFAWSAASFALSFPGEEKIAHETLAEQVSQGDSEDVIIIFDEAPAVRTAASLRAQSGASHDTEEIVRAKASLYRSMKDGVISRLSIQEVETVKDYSHLPAMFVKVKSLEGLKKLAAQAGVKGIYKNRPFKHLLSQSLPLIGQPAAEAAGLTGEGTAVAVLDGGVFYPDPAFGTCSGSSTPGECCNPSTNPGCINPPVHADCSVACVHDFAPNDGLLDDNDRHGTNVSAIVAGVAPGTKIIGLDVFDGDSAWSTDIISAINWVIAHKSAYNIVAINMSLGGEAFTAPCPGDGFAVPVANARAAGILSAVAAGNDGLTNAILSPACVPAAVSVGAVYDGGPFTPLNSADTVPSWSNSASFLTLLAPGSSITAGGWIMSGTSQATPHVAGSIAVLRSAFPAESVGDTVNRLISTGVSVTDTRDPFAPITKPRINLDAALDLPPTYQISGHVYANADNSPLSGVTVVLTGDAISKSVISGPDGSFLFDDLINGTYTVTPGYAGYNFVPETSDVIVSGTDQTNINFFRAFTISGHVMAKKTPMVFPEVTITLSGASSAETLTDSNGYYQFAGLIAGSYTVTPKKLSFVFSPATKGVSLKKKHVALDFKVNTYTISGTIKTGAGVPMSGVSLIVTGCGIEANTVTDSKGQFRISNLPNCSYTISPSDSSGHIFLPGSTTATVNNTNVAGIAFSSP